MVKTLAGETVETKNIAKERCGGGRMAGVPARGHWVPAEGLTGPQRQFKRLGIWDNGKFLEILEETRSHVCSN